MAKAKAVPSVNGTNGVNRIEAVPQEQESQGFVIPKLKMQTIDIPIIGTSSLIVHRWSEKARKQMLDKQTKKAAGPREAKNPEEDYQQARYISTEGWDGVPSVAFKAACVGACRFAEDIPMTMAKRLLYIVPDGRDKDGVELTQIVGKPRSRQDMVRLESGTADIRFRPEYVQWSAVIRVRFIASVISAEMVLNLVELAGSVEGVCEWRPSAPKSATGSHGCWAIRRG